MHDPTDREGWHARAPRVKAQERDSERNRHARNAVLRVDIS